MASSSATQVIDFAHHDKDATCDPSTPSRGRPSLQQNSRSQSSLISIFSGGRATRFHGPRSASPSPVGNLRRKFSFVGFGRHTTRHSSAASSATTSRDPLDAPEREIGPDLAELNRKLRQADVPGASDSMIIQGDLVHDFGSGGKGFGKRRRKELSTAEDAGPSTPERGRPQIQRSPRSLFTLKNVVSSHAARWRGTRSASPSPARNPRSKNETVSAMSTTRSPWVVPSRDASELTRETQADDQIVNVKPGPTCACSSRAGATHVYQGQQFSQPFTALKAAQDCKTLLVEAMGARSAKQTEICRSKCIDIIQSPYSDVVTKVYAYNILSTLASVGQASYFLDESMRLVKEHRKERPEVEKLVDVIELHRRKAEVRKEECGMERCQSIEVAKQAFDEPLQASVMRSRVPARAYDVSAGLANEILMAEKVVEPIGKVDV